MASITGSAGRYRAQVKHKGKYKSKICPTKGEARAWANAIEAEFRAADAGEIPNKKVADLFNRYVEEVSRYKKGFRWERIRIRSIIDTDQLAQVNIRELSSVHIAAWRDRRLRTVQGSTVGREWNLLSNVFTTAVREWRWLKTNPMSDVKRPAPGRSRSRRPTADELDRLSHSLGYGCGVDLVSARVAAAMYFSIETAMRAGEIAGLRSEHIDYERRTAKLINTKNGEDREVPLSSEAIRILQELPEHNPVFGLTASQIDSNFRRAKKLAIVEGLNFHDMRREALTRLSKKVDVLALARISGHRDLKILLGTYYAESMADVAKLLD